MHICIFFFFQSIYPIMNDHKKYDLKQKKINILITDGLDKSTMTRCVICGCRVVWISFLKPGKISFTFTLLMRSGFWNREKRDFIVEFDHFTPTEQQTYIWRNAYINTGDCRETWSNKWGFSAGDDIQWLDHISLLAVCCCVPRVHSVAKGMVLNKLSSDNDNLWECHSHEHIAKKMLYV